ncbi:Lysozyme-like domain-containing protein, partial [Cynara cardunculus var. scolymus]
MHSKILKAHDLDTTRALPTRMGVSFRYWDDCVDPQDMQEMWMDPDVSAEWITAGETVGSKVHLSRDTDGQPYLTQNEMKDMLCAIGQLESDRHLLTTSYNKKSKASAIGIMQILPKTAEWLISELGYNEYDLHGDSDLLYKPFINLYLGAAYLKWLSYYGNKERSEEFMVRSYHGGVKKATHKSTLAYWKRYLSVKESLPSRQIFKVDTLLMPNDSASGTASSNTQVPINVTWESRASPEDMEYMWNNPVVNKEWTKSGEKRGRVRISHDSERRPYLSRIELKGVAETVVSKHFSTNGVKPTILCAIAEIISKRYVNGIGQRTGLMGIDYPTACWIYRDLGYRAYKVESFDDLTKPFVSMYFGAAYLMWLSEYEGRWLFVIDDDDDDDDDDMKRSIQFMVQAYISGPKNLKLEKANPMWLKFEEALGRYEENKEAAPYYKYKPSHG